MYYVDLETIEFCGMPTTMVGWLERTNPFPTGEVPISIFEKIVQLLANPWQPSIAAGRHPCSFCMMTGGPAVLTLGSLSVTIEASNLFVPTSDALFAAPSLVVHYIDAHQYRPPDSFVAAVEGCAEMRSREYLLALARFRKKAPRTD